MDRKRYKTRREIAEVFGVGVRTVSLWMRRGCPVIYTGKKFSPGRGCHPLFIAEEVEQWLMAQAGGPHEEEKQEKDVMSSFFKNS